MVDSRKKIILGVTSSVAIYKALDLLRRLTERGFFVKVVLSPSAVSLISPVLFSSVGAEGVFWQLFSERRDDTHIPLTLWADLLLVAPVTANTLNKFASGIADNLLTTLFLSFYPKPIILAPAMHSQMWENPVVQNNVRELKKRGIKFVGPVKGRLANGKVGIGKMADVQEIIKELEVSL